MKTKNILNRLRSPAPGAQSSVVIENIEDLRQREGIDDVALHQEVRRLKVGDDVRLTFLNSVKACETLLVRIKRIDGSRFRGQLVQRPTTKSLDGLKLGSTVAFTATHIHSVASKT